MLLLSHPLKASLDKAKPTTGKAWAAFLRSPVHPIAFEFYRPEVPLSPFHQAQHSPESTGPPRESRGATTAGCRGVHPPDRSSFHTRVAERRPNPTTLFPASHFDRRSATSDSFLRRSGG